MDTSAEHGGTNRPRPEPGDDNWFDWVVAHAKPRPGWERHTIPLQLFDPIPPAEPRPALLLKNLLCGEVLPLERVELRSGRPLGGRDLAGAPPKPAAGRWPAAT